MYSDREDLLRFRFGVLKIDLFSTMLRVILRELDARHYDPSTYRQIALSLQRECSGKERF